MNKKVVLTGGSGHLGYHIGKILIKKKYKVLLLIRRHNSYTFELIRAGAKFRIVNFLDKKQIRNALKSYNILINTASNNPYNPQDEILKENLSLTKNIINSTIATKVQKIIHISSSIIYERKKSYKDIINENSKINYNENEYVKSKILIEKFIDDFNKKQNIDITRVYPGWIIGNQDVYFTPPSKFFYEDVYKKRLIFCFNGGISINTVEEISDAIVAAINSKANSKFILGGQNVSYYDLIKDIKNKSNKFFILFKLPNFLLKLISPCLSILSKFSNKFFLLKKQIDYSKKAITSFTYLSSKNSVQNLRYKVRSIDFIVSQILKNCERHCYKIHNLGKHNFFFNSDLKINKVDKKSRILITGVPGNLGNAFIDFIIKYNSLNKDKIYCNLLIQKKFEGLINLPKEFQIYYGSLNDEKVIKRSIKNVKSVFHLASKIYHTSTSSIYDTNYTSSKVFCEILIKNKIEKIIFMSTDSVLGYEKNNISFDDNKNYKPYGIYGKSKKKLEISK